MLTSSFTNGTGRVKYCVSSVLTDHQPPSIRTPNSLMAFELAARGCGFVIADEITASEELASGQLVRVSDVEMDAPAQYLMILPTEEPRRRRIRDLERFLYERLSS